MEYYNVFYDDESFYCSILFATMYKCTNCAKKPSSYEGVFSGSISMDQMVLTESGRALYIMDASSSTVRESPP